ncbi:MAG: SDR family oxidoreductase [Candidatus Binatia bacterium]|nr:SDR family oxidoreductase [Candidatus Binatia bacterium]
MTTSSDKVASVVVTGASTGIGRATVTRLDGEGFRVFAGVRKVADGEALRESASSRLTPLLVDVTDASSIGSAAEHVSEQVGAGGLAGLVNNAGVGVGGVLEFLDIEQFRDQLEVNLVGPVAVTKAFLPAIRRGRGRIVNISSDSGFLSTPFAGAYCASKFGLEAVSDALRRELRPWNIPVVIVEPGVIATPIWDKVRLDAKGLRAGLPDEAVGLYGAMLDKVESFVEQQVSAAIPPDAVADAVHRGLTARRPKLRYPVGNDAKMMRWVTRLLPARAVDGLVAGMISRA